MSDMIEVAASAVELTANGTPPRRVKLLPIGIVQMRDGRGPYFVRDRAHAAQIVAATREWLGAADFNFDYGHAVTRDQAAIAAGWAKADSLTVEADGIYAEVTWTAAAARKIADREYRYLSPLFLAAPGTNEVLRIKNAALVTIGAIDLPAIAASLKMGVKSEAGETRALTIDELKVMAQGGSVQVQMALTPSEQHQCQQLGWDFGAYLQEKIRQMEEAQASASSVAAAHCALAGVTANGLTADEIAACAALGIGHAEFLDAKGADGRSHAATAMLSADEVAACAMLGMSHTEFLDAKGADALSRAATARLTADEIAACAMTGMSHASFVAAKYEPIAAAAIAASLSPEEIAVCEMTGISHGEFLAAKRGGA